MTETTLRRQPRCASHTENASDRVDQAVRGQIANCSYGFVFNKITWRFDNGQLTLRGRVPTYYLKQVLQEHLRRVPDIGQIKNEVEVISATGISSEPVEYGR